MAIKAPEIRKEEAPEVPWATFLTAIASNWDQGEHISGIGRTGGGKTTLLVQLSDTCRYVVALLTKRSDPLFPLLAKRGYTPVEKTGDWLDREWAPKVAVHIPPAGLTRKETVRQADAIRRVFHRVWEQGNWTFYIDEIAELTDLLKLDVEARQMWKEARSSNVSLIAGTQRPSRVPLEMYSQARFLIFWKSNEREELRRMGGMNSVDPEPVRQIIPQLDRYEVLVVDTDTGDMVRTRPPKLT